MIYTAHHIETTANTILTMGRENGEHAARVDENAEGYTAHLFLLQTEVKVLDFDTEDAAQKAALRHVFG
tara:strand:+ start:1121 stop:1327 length:207 start_codon:yes stop_codon:yes gene_type:complete